VYVLNGWPFGGVDFDPWDPETQQARTLDEAMAEVKKDLRPWGGLLGYKWPSISSSSPVELEWPNKVLHGHDDEDEDEG
jgi:hypothetical protein